MSASPCRALSGDAQAGAAPGTVGGRIAATQQPRASRAAAIASASASAPTHSVLIGVSDGISARPWARAPSRKRAMLACSLQAQRVAFRPARDLDRWWWRRFGSRRHRGGVDPVRAKLARGARPAWSGNNAAQTPNALPRVTRRNGASNTAAPSPAPWRRCRRPAAPSTPTACASSDGCGRRRPILAAQRRGHRPSRTRRRWPAWRRLPSRRAGDARPGIRVAGIARRARIGAPSSNEAWLSLSCTQARRFQYGLQHREVGQVAAAEQAARGDLSSRRAPFQLPRVAHH